MKRWKIAFAIHLVLTPLCIAGPQLVLDLRVRQDTDMQARDSHRAELRHDGDLAGSIEGMGPLFFSLRLSNAGDEPISSGRLSASGVCIELTMPDGDVYKPNASSRNVSCGAPIDFMWNPGDQVIVHSFVYELDTGENFTYCFEEPGTYTVHR